MRPVRVPWKRLSTPTLAFNITRPKSLHVSSVRLRVKSDASREKRSEGHFKYQDIRILPEYLVFRHVDSKHGQPPSLLSTYWLRDQCQCNHCVSPDSGQKRFSFVDVPEVPSVEKAEIDWPARSLRVRWSNDFLAPGQPHKSVYPLERILPVLLNLDEEETSRHLLPNIWTKETMESRRRLGRVIRPYSDWMAGGEAFFDMLADLEQYGIVILDGVPGTDTAVEDIGGMIGPLETTFYGRTWTVESKPQAENVAYTNEFLGLHQDLLYMVQPPEIQLLHCLENDCEGGESIFSDGARAALQLQALQPIVYRTLQTMTIPYHYNRNGNTYFQERPVIDDGSIVPERVNWSPPFMAPLKHDISGAIFSARKDRVTAEYAGLGGPKPPLSQQLTASRAFRDALDMDGQGIWQHRLQPGQCVLFNNRRVLHGRNAFDTGSGGRRRLRGTYIGYSPFQSRVAQIPAHVREPQAVKDGGLFEALSQLPMLVDDGSGADEWTARIAQALEYAGGSVRARTVGKDKARRRVTAEDLEAFDE